MSVIILCEAHNLCHGRQMKEIIKLSMSTLHFKSVSSRNVLILVSGLELWAYQHFFLVLAYRYWQYMYVKVVGLSSKRVSTDLKILKSNPNPAGFGKVVKSGFKSKSGFGFARLCYLGPHMYEYA